MCIGIPMQVVQKQGVFALCRPYTSDDTDVNRLQRINMQLVAGVDEGDWVLTFLDSAREVLNESTAKQIHQALTALDLVMQGDRQGNQALEQLFAELFSDIIEQSPQLPAHLLDQQKQEN